MEIIEANYKPAKERPLKGFGRDELNIAEFPITLLTDEAPADVKTLTFSDQIIDRGETVTRSVTITGSDKYGLPRPLDMDVLLCLIQLTKKENDFSHSEVSFNRGDILKLMGLIDSGKNYARVDESLRRWLGVTLYYDKSWWNKEQQRWSTPVQEGFHILEHISLIDRKTKKQRTVENHHNQIEMFKSSFTWNKVFLQSCQADNLKYLDMDVYFSLKRAVSKQMYRFLDKRFYRNAVWTFDLKQFAFEHVGISRKYDTNKIKERLQHAFDELEAIDFLETSTKEERYEKHGKIWKIRLIHKRPATAPDTQQLSKPELESVVTPLVADLISSGVTAKTASDLVEKHQEETIRLKIEVFNWLVDKQDRRVAKSPAGYLVKSISDDYAQPKGFVSKADQAKRNEAKRLATEQTESERQRKRAEAARERRIDEQAKAHIKSRTPEQLGQLAADAIAAASETSRKSLEAPHMEPFRDTQITMLVREYIVRLIETGQLAIDKV